MFGVGGYNLGRHLPLYESQESGHAPLWGRVCHSLYFTLFAETGAVGTGIWIWIVASCFVTAAAVARQVVKKSKELQARDAAPPYEAKALVGMCRGLEAALIGFLAAGAFLTVNYYPVMWCLLGFIVAARLTLQNDPVLVGMMGAPSESSTGGQKLPRSASAGPGGGARLVSGSSPGPQVG